MYDGDVLSQCELNQRPHEHFSGQQYIIADAGYGASWWLCTPYKNPYAQMEHNRIFNHLYSSGRVTIEHTNESEGPAASSEDQGPFLKCGGVGPCSVNITQYLIEYQG
jgi:hypothetical protein